MVNKSKKWWAVKAKIVGKFGTVSACANQIGHSAEGIRSAVNGKCPGVLKKLEAVLR